jgi:hypothetical protein
MRPVPLLFLLPFFLSPLQAAPAERLVIGAEAGKGLVIVDPAADNKVLFHHPLGAVHGLFLLPNGNFLTQDGWPRVVEIDLDGKTVWEYDAKTENRRAEDGKVEIHSFERLENGNTLIVESGAGRILEVTPAKSIVKELPLEVSAPNPHSDTRQVHRLANGHFLVAHEADQIVKEYDADGKVVWEFPIPLFGKSPANGHGPEAFGGRCFSAIIAANGNYLITTGNGHSILEVTPSKEIVWKLEQNDLPGITLAWVTTIEELKNGNLRFGNCHAGPDNPQIIEVTRQKEVVWTFHDFTNFGNSLANTLVLDGTPAKTLRKKLNR